MTAPETPKAGKDFIGVGVGGVILRDNKILLLLRTRPPEVGSWSIPGGKVDFGETIEAALVREIKEELNVDSEVITLLAVTNHILPDEQVHWVSPPFLVKIIGEPTNLEPEKHKDMQWFAVDDLPENLTMTTKEALKAFKVWAKDHPFS
jgi:8-oxo-dGTP diphosphatase